MNGALYHLQPLGVDIEARPGESLMDAANRAGLRWPTICGGEARCGVCHARIVDSSQALPEPGDAERHGLRLVPTNLSTEQTRLACQLRAVGEITVWKPGVRPRDR